MYTPLMIFLYIAFSISLVCSLYTTYKLIFFRNNILVGILALSTSIVSIDVLASLLYKNELENAPYGFCFAQGLVLQYACYLTMACALCFAVQTFRLLVLYKQGTNPILQKIYYAFIAIYPVIMTITLGVVSSKYKAIVPRQMNCDVMNPIWVRLIGYSGVNLVLSFPGTIISGCSAYVVFRHLDQFKTGSTSSLTSSLEGLNSQIEDKEIGILPSESMESTIAVQSHEIPNSPQSPNHVVNISSPLNISPTPPTSPNSPNYPYSNSPNSNSSAVTSPLRKSQSVVRTASKKQLSSRDNVRSYEITRRAALRMAGFSLGFAFINLMGCVKTILNIISSKPEETNITSNDWIGSFLGIIIYIVFGLPDKYYGK